MHLLLILGPPAVGKMTVGRAVAERSDYKLFHNHHTIELLLDVFDYGTLPFRTLNTEFRRRLLEEAATAGTDLVFTFVMGMDEQAEADYRMTAEPGRDAPGERLLARWPHLAIDNTDLSADETADRILAWLVTDG